MRLKLHASIMLVVLIGLLIPVSASSLLTLEQHEQALGQRLSLDHQRITEILMLGMQQPLWNISRDAGVPLFQSLFGDERVSMMTVRDKQFGILLSQEYPERRKGSQARLEREVVYNGQVIGHVSVEIDSGQRDAEIAYERRIFAATVFGQLLLSVILIVALLQARLLKPVRRLMRESECLARRELAAPFFWRGDDELGQLGHSLERTRQALQAMFAKIETQNHALEQDIERRTLIEKEIQHHRHHLEELVKERTAELTIAKEKAELANRSKSTFLASMSHELRTPLNAILGYAQVLKRDTSLSESQATGLNTIQQGGEHLLTIITDLLDLAKIEAGKFDLFPGPVDLAAFLQGIADMMRVKAEQKDLLFIYQASPDLACTVQIDEKRLRQVLLNLLGNAVKFTDVGQVCLRVRSEPVGGNRTRLCFEVEDTGIGLQQSQLETIFQPFEQVGDLERRFAGTGLGLSISRQLVRLMDSHIHVASEPGKGSLFSFELLVVAQNVEGVFSSTIQPMTALAAEGVTRTGARADLLIAPPSEEMEILYELAREGNMRDVRRQAAHIAALDQRYRPFANKLNLLAMRYQSRAILDLVEQYLERRQAP